MLYKFHGEHRKLVSRFFVVLACIFVVYFGLAYALHKITDVQRETCGTSNAGRLAGLRNANKGAAVALAAKAVAISEHKPAAAELAQVEIEAEEAKAKSYMDIAEKTGHQTTDGAVTVECSSLNPEVLWWPGE